MAVEKGTLAFLPWVQLKEPIEVGGFNFEPWSSRSPSPEWSTRIMGSYCGSPGSPIEKATVVSIGGAFDSDWSSETIQKFFEVRELISFVALMQRRFFDHSPYVNDAALRAVVQHFDWSTGGGVTRHSRRRDGRQIVYVSDEVHQELAPDQVSANQAFELDTHLLMNLHEIVVGGRSDCAWLLDAVTLFNLSNSDSASIREHTEILLTVACAQAIPRLHGFREDSVAPAFAAALDTVVPPTKGVDALAANRNTGTPKQGVGLRELWFRDLYQTRGTFAHGGVSSPVRRRWNVREHLLLAAHIFPRLILVELQHLGARALSSEDLDSIAGFDALLCMSDCYANDKRSHLWPRVLREAKDASALERVIAATRAP